MVINGIRYYVAIRLDSGWSYLADGWKEGQPHPLEGTIRTDPDAEREATTQILKAQLKKEPWLYAEIAPGDQESAAGTPTAAANREAA